MVLRLERQSKLIGRPLKVMDLRSSSLSALLSGQADILPSAPKENISLLCESKSSRRISP